MIKRTSYYGSDFSGDQTDQEIDSDVDFDFSECDTSKRLRVQALVTKTCGCAHGYKRRPCSSTFQIIEDIIDCRNNCGELSSTEQDLVVLGMTQGTINFDDVSYSERAEKQHAILFPQPLHLPENLFFHAVSTRPDSTV